jgi:hypothetical protein
MALLMFPYNHKLEETIKNIQHRMCGGKIKQGLKILDSGFGKYCPR